MCLFQFPTPSSPGFSNRVSWMRVLSSENVNGIWHRDCWSTLVCVSVFVMFDFNAEQE